MKNIFRRLYDLRCPACNALQGPFALGSTFKGGITRFAINKTSPCASCHQLLRLLPRHGVGKTIVLQLCAGLVGVAAFFLICIPLLVMAVGQFGVWGLVSWPFILGLWAVISATISRKFGPYMREVKIV